jgi:hypothetical protein
VSSLTVRSEFYLVAYRPRMGETQGEKVALDPDHGPRVPRVNDAAMAGYDWKFVLSLVASLALASGAICILLFAM